MADESVLFPAAYYRDGTSCLALNQQQGDALAADGWADRPPAPGSELAVRPADPVAEPVAEPVVEPAPAPEPAAEEPPRPARFGKKK